jgi:Holliday junction resolvase RusA-like endonuclease
MTEPRVLEVLIVPVGWKQPGRGKGGQRYTLPNQREYKHMVRAAWQERYRDAEVLQGAVKMKVSVWMPRPKGRVYKRKDMPAYWHTVAPDLTNIVKLTEDSLKGLAFKDDCQVCEQHSWKKVVEGTGQPRIIIRIEELE